ncbi:magnesium/cobalt transporter CorA [bacterium]|nr:magnesium/cobalt transporter CorA [bacterium]NUP91922.1 magnesium/cobalt transporter CorA [Candidatus Omnitrophota bacterium]
MMAHRKQKPVPRRRKSLRQAPPGSPPGTIAVDPDAPAPSVRVLGYGPDTFHEEEIQDSGRLKSLAATFPVTWISVSGLGDSEVLSHIAQTFGIHPLALEDVVNVHQRPKADMYGDLLFVVMRGVYLDQDLKTEQVSLFLGKNFVLTFQEGHHDSLEVIRERIRLAKGRIRNHKADYLAYSLLDAIIDGYYLPLEVFGERIDHLEDTVLIHPSRQAVLEIHSIKRDLLDLRRAIWSAREMINDLLRDPIPLLSEETRPYLKDCYDHIIQIIDLVETDRELGSDLMDLYLSATSNRLNEIMKVLAIITTIFMPMSFVAGLYGMNFNSERSPWNMPELNWYWGYPIVLGMMGLMAVLLMGLFRWKGWLEPLDTPTDPARLGKRRFAGRNHGDGLDP